MLPTAATQFALHVKVEVLHFGNGGEVLSMRACVQCREVRNSRGYADLSRHMSDLHDEQNKAQEDLTMMDGITKAASQCHTTVKELRAEHYNLMPNIAIEKKVVENERTQLVRYAKSVID
jgi:hypothetical protein